MGRTSRSGVALGVRRLSVVDVESGHQPFADESGEIWAIQNGEIYNHAELRGRLRQRASIHAAAATPKSCRICYERYGVAFQEHLRGMFGLAVWDGAEQVRMAP